MAGTSRILVTGATGFVGRHLCESLVHGGFSVTAPVRTNSRLDGLPSTVQLVPVAGIDGGTNWDRQMLSGCDTIVHLAARVHVLKETAADADAEFHNVNVAGTETLARAAAGSVRRFVYVSSLHAMRSLSEEVLDETSPCCPDTPYGRSKLEAERRLQLIGRETGLEIVVVRPPPVYGPGGVGNLMSLLKWVRRGWPLPVGGITNQRSLVYVGNLVDALLRCITSPRASGETFLVSDGEDLSLADLVKRAACACRRQPRLWPAPEKLLRMAGRWTGRTSAIDRLLGSLAVDTSNIQRVLTWRPAFSLDDALGRTATWLETAS